MPEIIERGYLYIAQPPLYKVKRGQSGQYLKDEDALENYLIDAGLEDAVLTLGSGEERAGADLREIVVDAIKIRSALDALHSRYAKFVVEQVAISGALNPEQLQEPGKANEAASYIAQRLDLLSDELERGWQGSVTDDGGLTFTRELRGVTEVHLIDGALIGSADARRLNQKAEDLRSIYGQSATLRRKDVAIEIHSPTDLLEAVLSVGQKGLSLQRYKGLGEMNPDQLWETTLDESIRTLLQVHVRELDEADDMFAKLMGDVVEYRREFIQENALAVANLDV